MFIYKKKDAQKVAEEIIDYLSRVELFEDVVIYFDGHKFTSDKPKGEFVERKTPEGNAYYDLGEADVLKWSKYANPDAPTFGFDGYLYEAWNDPDGRVQEGVEKIAKKYGLFPESGEAYDFSLFVDDVPDQPVDELPVYFSDFSKEFQEILVEHFGSPEENNWNGDIVPVTSIPIPEKEED